MAKMLKEIASILLDSALPESLSQQLGTLWNQTFLASDNAFSPLQTGDKAPDNLDAIHLARAGDQIAGTSHLTQSQNQPVLGGSEGAAAPATFPRAIGETETWLRLTPVGGDNPQRPPPCIYIV